MQTKLIQSFTTFVAALTLGAFGACDEETLQEESSVVEASEEPLATPAEFGLGDAWTYDGRGLWVTMDEEGERKFLGIGEAGQALALEHLSEVEAELTQSLSEHESDDTRQKLWELRGLIEQVQEEPASAVEDELTPRCSFSIEAFVDAKPSACGTAALAEATAHPCGTTKATVHTYAKASRGHLTQTQECGPYAANPATCESTASITGSGACSSFAFAKITGPGVYIYIWDQNNQCGACGGGNSTSGWPYPPSQCPGVNVECVAN